MGKMFKMLDEALSEALEYVKGNVKLRTKEVFIPDAPKKFTKEDIKKLRSKLTLTQKALALWLNVSLNTVQAWEQGDRSPNQSSLRLLEMFEKDFSFIKKILTNKPEKKKHSPKSSSSVTHSKGHMIARGKM